MATPDEHKEEFELPAKAIDEAIINAQSIKTGCFLQLIFIFIPINLVSKAAPDS